MNPPSFLDTIGKKEWNRIINEIKDKEALSKLDMGMLAIYCNYYSVYITESKFVKELGATTTVQSGYSQISGHMAAMNGAAKIMLPIAKEFGFTPLSRKKQQSGKDNNDDFNDYLNN